MRALYEKRGNSEDSWTPHVLKRPKLPSGAKSVRMLFAKIYLQFYNPLVLWIK